MILISGTSYLLILIWFIIIPAALGLCTEKYVNTWKDKGFSLAAVFVMGFVTMLASFQLVAVPLIAMDKPFSLISGCFLVLTLIEVAISIFISRKRLMEEIRCFFKNTFSMPEFDRITGVIWTVVIVLIVIMTWLLTCHMHTDTDDARFIAEAMEAYERGSILKYHPLTGMYYGAPAGEMLKDVTSPYPFFIASISKYINVVPAVTAHTLLPLFLIPLSFAAFYTIGKYFFTRNESNLELNSERGIAIYMFLICFIMLFSYESIYSYGYTLLTIVWQGRSILAVIIMPLLIYMLMRYITENNINGWHYMVTFLIFMACADLSGMGLVIPIVVGFIYSITVFMIRKDIKRTCALIILFFPNILYFAYYFYITRGPI